MTDDYKKAFYRSKQWQEVRAYILMRDGYLCKHCGAPGKEVHHIIHLTRQNINDPAVTLNPDNLELLCGDCHKKEHYREKGFGHSKDSNKVEIATQLDRNYMFDANGMLVERPR